MQGVNVCAPSCCISYRVQRMPSIGLHVDKSEYENPYPLPFLCSISPLRNFKSLLFFVARFTLAWTATLISLQSFKAQLTEHSVACYSVVTFVWDASFKHGTFYPQHTHGFSYNTHNFIQKYFSIFLNDRQFQSWLNQQHTVFYTHVNIYLLHYQTQILLLKFTVNQHNTFFSCRAIPSSQKCRILQKLILKRCFTSFIIKSNQFDWL